MIFKQFAVKCNPLWNFVRSLSKTCFVYLTNVTDSHQNLAFEDWMYEKVDFQKCNCLFIWRNDPCVVIGRHQNPWKECNVTDLLQRKVNICRRKSGGGAVYHDKGNINFTFFTDRKTYDRKWNLNVIVSGLKQKWPQLNVSVNNRDDILLNNFKISGSSSKLGRNTAYHHCTLLVSSNKDDIQRNLQVKQSEVTCSATESVRSIVSNLQNIDKSVNFNDVCNAVSSSYTSLYSSSKLIELKTDDEHLLPGVTQLADNYRSWEWIYGKTPNFTIKNEFEHSELGTIFIKMEIKKGLIHDIEFVTTSCATEFDDVRLKLVKVKFCQEEIINALNYPTTSKHSETLHDFLCQSILSFI